MDKFEVSSDRQQAIHAVEAKVQRQLVDWLRQLWPDCRWTPTPEQLHQHGIIYDAYAELRDFEVLGEIRTVFVGVAECRLTQESWRWLLHEARLAHSQDRLRTLAKFFLVPVGILSLILLLLPYPIRHTRRSDAGPYS